MFDNIRIAFFVITLVYVDVNNMSMPIIMCSIVGATILMNGIEFSIHRPE